MAQFLAPEQLENASGVPLNGGKKHVYAVGTTTPLALFSDDGMTTPAANPIVADSSGAFAGVFLAETECKQIIATSADVTVFTRTVFYTVGVSNVLAADDVSYDGATSGLASEDVQAAIDEVVSLQGGTQAWSSASDGPIVTGTSTNAGAAAGPLVEMYRNSASPANSDAIGGLRLTGKNASGVKTTYAQIHGVITDVTNGSEDGEVYITTKTNGSDNTPTKFTGGTVDAANGFYAGGVKWGTKSGTVQATTSGTTKDFTSLPAGLVKITIEFDGVSTNGTSNKLIQIGDSGGVEATGYLGASSVLSSGATSANYTTGFGINSALAANVLHGAVVLTLVNASTNTWSAFGVLATSDAAATYTVAGNKSLSATLDRVRITTVNGTDAFDAGQVNILYE